MTKKEIAFTLAMQYSQAEKDFFAFSDKYKEARESEELSSQEKTWYRGTKNNLRDNMITIKKSANLLGITDTQWMKALTDAYIEVNKAM